MSRILLLLSLLYSAVALGQPPVPIPTNTADQQSQSAPTEPIEIRSDAIDAIQQSIETIATNTAPDEIAQQNQADREETGLDLARLDLDAQQSMAKYTSKIFTVTAWGLGVGIITIIALGVTIHQTRAIIRQDRAWITPAIPAFEGAPSIDGKPSARIDWKNSGKTPAIDVMAHRTVLITDTIAGNESDISTIKVYEKHQSDPICCGIIGPDDIFPIDTPLSDDFILAIKDAKKSFIIIIEIEYLTIHDRTSRRKTTCAFSITWQTDESMVLGTDNEGFDISPIGVHRECT